MAAVHANKLRINLWYMLPCFTVNNAPYATLMYTVLSGDCPLRYTVFGKIANRYNITFGQCRAWVIFALYMIVPFFDCSISIVFGWCAKPEVSRVNTSRVVALVTNKHAFWDRSMTEFVANAMSAIGFLISAYYTIAPDVLRSFPHPAIIERTLVNLFPKAFSEWADKRGWSFPVRAIVSSNKAGGLSFYVSDVGSSAFGERCSLAASAFTKFFRGRVGGIITHVVSSFIAIVQAGDCFSNRPVFSLTVQV